MQRSTLFAAVLFALSGSLASAQEKPAPPATPPAVDPTHEEATKLEAELTKYSDTAPEAADKKAYQAAYPHYGRLYTALKSEFGEIARLVGQR